MITREALSGYVLEEMLALLLKSSGFELIVDAKHDPVALVDEKGALRVRGRGADHQVDVLGQLRLRIRYLYPIRLFVEAKNTTASVQLPVIRNAVGVINDVNEHYSSSQASEVTYKRYDYRYALFSASGFSANAVKYAATHRISLIDLSSPAFRWLPEAANRTADALLAAADAEKLKSFPTSQMREALRRAYDTWPEPGADASTADDRQAAKDRARHARPSLLGFPPDVLADIASQSIELDGHLYLAMTSSPFIALLQPDDPDAAQELLRTSPKLGSMLRFRGPDDEHGEWEFSAEQRPVTFKMASAPGLEPYLVGEEDHRQTDRRMSIVTGDDTVDMAFAPVRTDALSTDDTPRQMRRNRLDVTSARAYTTEERDDVSTWSIRALSELIHRLRAEHRHAQADAIVFAAHNAGEIRRDQLYDLAGYPPARMLKGFTRPTNRITRDLIREGLLPDSAALPLQTRYASGVLATHFVVPLEFGWLLRDLDR